MKQEEIMRIPGEKGKVIRVIRMKRKRWRTAAMLGALMLITGIVPPRLEVFAGESQDSSQETETDTGGSSQGAKTIYSSYDTEVEVSQDGLHEITVEYIQPEYNTRDLIIDVEINGSLPFPEAEGITLPRIYQNDGGIRSDANGNEIAPRQVMVLEPVTHTLMNTSGFYEGSYQFPLKKGKNDIHIDCTNTDVEILGVSVSPCTELPSYEEYLEAHPGEDTKGRYIVIQAEDAEEKTTSMLYPTYDRKSAATQSADGKLNSPSTIRINTAGGEMWKQTGQWMSWEVEVEESGYYNIGFKYRQSYKDGLFTSRKVYIDGEVPFEAMSGIQFVYDAEWQTMTLADEAGEEYRLWLEQGIHTIKMEVTMGVFAESLKNINSCVQTLNDLYLQIVMITGAKPDSYTDYFLADRVENLTGILQESREILVKELDYITSITGGKGSATSAIDTMQIQLGVFLKDPEEISKRLGSMKNNISALGTWVVDMQDQALQLDYIYLKSPDVETPEADVGFFQGLGYQLARFFTSFADKNQQVGASEGENRTITVWLNSTINANANGTSAGRDQAQVLKDMIDELFTPETGISVELMLVQGSLIEATLAGTGPDVALFTAEDQPVNFAIRGALQDLSVFADWEEVKSRFYDSAMAPFEYEGGWYAVPETQLFNMLFYRTDVFAELGIEPPNTWEEFYTILPVIQRNNLQVTTQDLFATLLFQNGGEYYNEEHTAALLDSPEAVDAMQTYTDLYTQYGFEVKTDFYSRFRSGEVVMSIQPYNMYNQLVAAAPEINGRWDMVPIPGTVQEDGHIDRSASSTLTATIMLSSAEDKEAAWRFIEWWSRDDVKARYGTQIEALLGGSARFTPANIGTLESLPWPEAQYANLRDAMAALKGIPQIPGSYYTSRAVTNAFRSVVYNAEPVRRVLMLQNDMIDYEITRKRAEFGLDGGGEKK